MTDTASNETCPECLGLATGDRCECGHALRDTRGERDRPGPDEFYDEWDEYTKEYDDAEE